MKSYLLSYSGDTMLKNNSLKIANMVKGEKLGGCIVLKDGMLLVDRRDGRYICEENKTQWEAVIEWDDSDETGEVIGYIENNCI